MRRGWERGGAGAEGGGGAGCGVQVRGGGFTWAGPQEDALGGTLL